MQVIITIFSVLLIGFAARKFLRLNEETLANLVLYIACPCLTFFALYTQELVFTEVFSIGFSAVLIALGCGLLMKLILLALKEKENGMVLPAMLMNSTYLGFPVALAVFGEIGLQKAIIFDAFIGILMHTFGVYLVQNSGISKRKKLLQALKIPAIYAIFFGIILNIACVKLPSGILLPIELVGKAAIPLALIAMGSKLSGISYGKLTLKTLKLPALSILVRFAGGFAMASIAILVLPLSGTAKSIVLLIALMPPAINSYIFNEKFEGDASGSAIAVIAGIIIWAIAISFMLP